jgi:hypothetical protein
MSIASLGLVGSLAGTAVSQRAGDAEKTERETVEQDRTAQAAGRAENAAGIGQTEEDSQTAERDADGRRLWERPPAAKPAAEAPPEESRAALSKDPSGACGGLVDLVG